MNRLGKIRPFFYRVRIIAQMEIVVNRFSKNIFAFFNLQCHISRFSRIFSYFLLQSVLLKMLFSAEMLAFANSV